MRLLAGPSGDRDSDTVTLQTFNGLASNDRVGITTPSQHRRINDCSETDSDSDSVLT